MRYLLSLEQPKTVLRNEKRSTVLNAGLKAISVVLSFKKYDSGGGKLMADDKRFTERFMEGFGLEFPKDADKFLEIFERFADGGTFGRLSDELCEAFPDKRESILSVPIYVNDGGE